MMKSVETKTDDMSGFEMQIFFTAFWKFPHFSVEVLSVEANYFCVDPRDGNMQSNMSFSYVILKSTPIFVYNILLVDVK